MTEPGVIRVDISSTFCDMRPGREHLHHVVFLAVQTRRAPLGVRAEAVDPLKDLQSEDEAEGPRILKQCLDAAEACGLFFIALLGERYGRPLAQIPHDATAAYPGLNAHTRESRMVLEITHVVRDLPQTPYAQENEPDPQEVIRECRRFEGSSNTGTL